ncbi:hypothetical protein LTR04_002660 [Oleoguttula sp. CCFEE 6159]|nr:hypothetical protein LTR04_002660 [Oleoguttula sp. CCFEE 6159]
MEADKKGLDTAGHSQDKEVVKKTASGTSTPKEMRAHSGEQKESDSEGFTSGQEKRLKKWFIGSIDQGTTSSRFLIFDGTGNPVASHSHEFQQMYRKSG